MSELDKPVPVTDIKDKINQAMKVQEKQSISTPASESKVSLLNKIINDGTGTTVIKVGVSITPYIRWRYKEHKADKALDPDTKFKININDILDGTCIMMPAILDFVSHKTRHTFFGQLLNDIEIVTRFIPVIPSIRTIFKAQSLKSQFETEPGLRDKIDAEIRCKSASSTAALLSSVYMKNKTIHDFIFDPNMRRMYIDKHVDKVLRDADKNSILGMVGQTVMPLKNIMFAGQSNGMAYDPRVGSMYNSQHGRDAMAANALFSTLFSDGDTYDNRFRRYPGYSNGNGYNPHSGFSSINF